MRWALAWTGMAVAVLAAAVRRRPSRLQPVLRALRAMLSVALLTTGMLLLLEGRWQEALPLHLCSVSALVALALAFGAGQGALDFLWYLGMPGAMLALLFPAPAVSRCQLLLDTAYFATHALILAIPLLCLAAGQRVRRGRTGRMLLIMHALALAAFAVNACLGTDFLFLSAPPAGTPLETAFAWGRPAYLMVLEALLAAWLTLTGGLLMRLFPDLTQ